jgi:hypothetical protein
MTARPRLKRLALWTAIAIPLLAAFYLGAYCRMLTTITVVSISMPQNTPMVQRQPRYNLPWPIPAQYNHSELQPGLQHAFAPAHRMDQWLRPDVWASQKVDLKVQANGSGVLMISEGTTKPF